LRHSTETDDLPSIPHFRIDHIRPNIAFRTTFSGGMLMLHKRKQEKPRQFSLQESRYGNISKLYKLSKLDDLLLNPKLVAFGLHAGNQDLK
jgi:hypothetical protein